MKTKAAATLQPLYGSVCVRVEVANSKIAAEPNQYIGERESISPLNHCKFCYTLNLRDMKIIDHRGETMACSCDCHIRMKNPYNTIIK